MKYSLVHTRDTFIRFKDMEAVGLTLLLLSAFSQIHMDQSFRYPSPIHYYVRTFKRVDTYQPPPTTTTAQPISKNIQNLMRYQKAFTAAVNEIRKLFDNDTADSAKIDSILQDLKINRLMM